MGQTVVFIVLTVVESNLLTIDGYTHGYQFVYQLIAQPTHAECIDKDNDDGQQMVEENHESVPRAIDKDNDDGQQMVEENHESVPRACNQSFLDEDTCQHSSEDTACAVSGEYVEGIVDAAT